MTDRRAISRAPARTSRPTWLWGLPGGKSTRAALCRARRTPPPPVLRNIRWNIRWISACTRCRKTCPRAWRRCCRSSRTALSRCPVAEQPPELYQLVGAALRDVAQARHMADLFSRQISYCYEKDPVLRRFPVPRVEVDEVEMTFQFLITKVAIDPDRHTSRNSAIGSLF